MTLKEIELIEKYLKDREFYELEMMLIDARWKIEKEKHALKTEELNAVHG